MDDARADDSRPAESEPRQISVTVLDEAGYDEALLGLSLSHGQDPAKMPSVACRLAPKDGGHNKFLESIMLWLDITAPRYWWSQFDTYRIGVTKQSASTMNTLLKRPLTQSDFAYRIPEPFLEHINHLIASGNLELAKSFLPEGFLQQRIVCLSYLALRRILTQRSTHKLPEWRMLRESILAQVEHPELLPVDEAA